MRILLTAALLALPTATYAICGDCNFDGRVQINELVESVGNALGGSAAATPTVPPNHCPGFMPGAHVKTNGGTQDWVVVEVPVYLAGASTAFAVRYPVRLADDGSLYYVPAVIDLTRNACVGGSACSGDEPVTLCGLPTSIARTVGSVQHPLYQEQLRAGKKAASLTTSVDASALVIITVDPAYEPVYLSFAVGDSVKADVTPVSSFGYSFPKADYPGAPSLSISRAKNDLETLIQYVSIRPLQ